MDWNQFLKHTMTNLLFTAGFLLVAGLFWMLTTPKENDDDDLNDFF